MRTLTRCLACAAVVATPYLWADEKRDAVDLVEKAILFAKTNGREKVLAELNTPKGLFDKGELYVFAYDFNGVVVAHPNNPKLVGRNMLEMPDLDGKLFRKDIVKLAKSPGTGWVDYTYKNPQSGKAEDKSTYLKASGDLIFCCGVYK